MEMDFKSMKRRALQALCKKHGLPANSTNSQMVESLASLLQPKGCLKGSSGSSGEDAGQARGASKKVSFLLEKEKLNLDEFEENLDGRKRRLSRRKSFVVSDEKMETAANFESPGRELDVPVRTRRSRSLATAVIWSPVVEKKNARKGVEDAEDSPKVPPLKEAPLRRSHRQLSKTENSLPEIEKHEPDEAGVEVASLPAGSNAGDEIVKATRKRSRRQAGNHTWKPGDLASSIESAPLEVQKGKPSQSEEPPRRSTRSSQRNVLGDDTTLLACDSSAEDEKQTEKKKQGKRVRKMSPVREAIENSDPKRVASTATVENLKEHISEVGVPPRRSTRSAIVSEIKEPPKRQTRTSVRNTAETEVHLPTQNRSDLQVIKKNKQRKQGRKHRSVREVTRNFAPNSEPASASEEAKVHEEPQRVVQHEEAPRRSRRNAPDHAVSLLVDGKLGDGDETVGGNELQKQPRKLGLKRGAQADPKLNESIDKRKRKLGGHRNLEDQSYLTQECPIMTSEVGDLENSNTFAVPTSEGFAADLSNVVETENAKTEHINDFVKKNVSEVQESTTGHDLDAVPICDDKLKESGNGTSLEDSLNDGLNVSVSQSSEKLSYYLDMEQDAREVSILKVAEGSTEVTGPQCSNCEVNLGSEGAVVATSDSNLYVDDKTTIQCFNGEKQPQSQTPLQVTDAGPIESTLVADTSITPVDTIYDDSHNEGHEAADIIGLPLLFNHTKEPFLSDITEASPQNNHEGTPAVADIHDNCSPSNLYVDNKTTIQCLNGEKQPQPQTPLQVTDAESIESTLVADTSRTPVDTIYDDSHNEGHEAADIIGLPLSFNHTKEPFLSDIIEASPENNNEGTPAVADTHDAREMASLVISCSPIQTSSQQGKTVGLFAKVANDTGLGGLSSMKRVFINEIGTCGTSLVTEPTADSSEESDVAKESVLSEVKKIFALQSFSSEEKLAPETGGNNDDGVVIEGEVPQSHLASRVLSDDQVPDHEIVMSADIISNGGLVVFSSSSNDNAEGPEFFAPVDDGELSSSKLACEVRETILEVVHKSDAEDSIENNKENSPSIVDCVESEENPEVLVVANNSTGFSFLKSVHMSTDIKETLSESPSCLKADSVMEVEGKFGSSHWRSCNNNEDAPLLCSGGNKPDKDAEVQEVSDKVVDAKSYKSTIYLDGSYIDALPHKDDNKGNAATSTTGVSFSCCHANDLSALTGGDASSQTDLEESADLLDAHVANEVEAHDNSPLPTRTIENQVDTVEHLAMVANVVTENSLSVQSNTADEVTACKLTPCAMLLGQLATGWHGVVGEVEENLAQDCDSRSHEAFSVEPRENFTYSLDNTVKGGATIGKINSEVETVNAEVRQTVNAEVRRSLDPMNLAADLCLDDQEEDHTNETSSEDKVQTVALFAMDANTVNDYSANLQSGSIGEVRACQMAPGNLSSDQLATGEDDSIHGVKEEFAEGGSPSYEAFSYELEESYTSACSLVNTAEVGLETDRGKNEDEKIIRERRLSLKHHDLASDLCLDDQEHDERNGLTSEDIAKDSLVTAFSSFGSSERHPNMMGMAVAGGLFSSIFNALAEGSERLDDNALSEERDSRATLGQFYEDKKDTYPVSGHSPEELAEVQESICQVTDAEIPEPAISIGELRVNTSIVFEGYKGKDSNLCDAAEHVLSMEEFSLISRNDRTPPNHTEKPATPLVSRTERTLNYTAKPATPLETPAARERAIGKNGSSPVIITRSLGSKTKGLLADQPSDSENVEGMSREFSVETSSTQSKIEACRVPDNLKEAFVEVHVTQSCSPLCKAFSETSGSHLGEDVLGQHKVNHAYGVTNKDYDLIFDESSFSLNIFRESDIVADAESTGSRFLAKAPNAAVQIFERSHELEDGDADDKENLDTFNNEAISKCKGGTVEVPENIIVQDEFDREAFKHLGTPFIPKGYFDIDGESDVATVTSDSSLKNLDYQGSMPSNDSIVPAEILVSPGKFENEHLKKANAVDTHAEDVHTDYQEFSSLQKEDYARALGSGQESSAREKRIFSEEILGLAERIHTEQGDLSYKFSIQVDGAEEISNSSMGRFDNVHEDPEVAVKEFKEKMEAELYCNDHEEVKMQYDAVSGLGVSDEKETDGAVPFASDDPHDGTKFEVIVAKVESSELGLLHSLSGELVSENCIESAVSEFGDQDVSGELSCKTSTSMEAEPCIGGGVAGQFSFNIPIGTSDCSSYSPSKSGIGALSSVFESEELEGSRGHDQLVDAGHRLKEKALDKLVQNTPMKLVESFDSSVIGRLKDKENTPIIKMDGHMKRNLEKSATTGSVRRPLQNVQNNNLVGK